MNKKTIKINFGTYLLSNIGMFAFIFLSNVFLNTYELYLQHLNITANDLFISDLLRYFKSLFVVLLLSTVYMFLSFKFGKLILLGGGICKFNIILR